ncbi:hypothetical protein BDV98DRAFT_598593 [Pterulicium gracile]|uniref:Uncharacterized protein n=1 Tax=Pterulicium gracile TaxID=1884261 RepID=A0A5C3PZX4_9AGAR|nr:hypothetical protein BDV98DRAFT_598593 [Pterula gracilis]
MTGYIKQISIPTTSALTTGTLSLSDCNWGTWSPEFLRLLADMELQTFVVATMLCSIAKSKEDYLEDKKGKNVRPQG